jgi:hypothetical protein
MTPSPKEIATIAVLNTKLDGAIGQISELKGQFDIFQANFLRQDVYTIRHEELLRQVSLNTREIEHLQKNRWVMPIARWCWAES